MRFKRFSRNQTVKTNIGVLLPDRLSGYSMRRILSFVRQHARLFTFLGALALTSTFVLVLFQQARAVDVTVSTPSGLTTASTSATATVTVTIPANQLLPIYSVQAKILRGNANDRNGATTLETVNCAGSTGCNGVPISAITSQASTKISAVTLSGSPSQAFGQLTVTHGAGYVSATDIYTAGYGYGYGLGYGGPSGDTLTYVVTFAPDALGQGYYWVQVTLDTGSTVMGNFVAESNSFHILPGTSQGTPGLSQSSTPTPTPSATPSPTPTPTPAAPEYKAPAAVDKGNGTKESKVTIDHTSSDGKANIDFSSVNKSFKSLAIDLGGKNASGIEVTLTTHEGAFNRTSDGTFVEPIPTSFGASLYFELGIAQPNNTFPSARLNYSLDFSLPDVSDHDAHHVTLIHQVNRTWQPEPTMILGNKTFRGWFSSVSPFAVAFDQEDPVVSALVPADGASVGTRPLISADLSDNRGIDTGVTTLSIDGQVVSASVGASSVAFTPTVPLTPGAHTVKVHTVDLSGRAVDKSWSFNVAEVISGAIPITPGQIGQGAFAKTGLPVLSATYGADVVPSTVTMTLDGVKVTAIATATGITYTPAKALSEGVHTVQVTASDANGNGGLAKWTFTVDTVAPAVTSMVPADGAKLDTPVGTITVDVSDATSGVKKVTMTIDGSDVSATLANGKVTYTPKNPLGVGSHTVKVVVEDNAGNSDTKTSGFTVAQAATPAPTKTPGPDSLMTVLAVALAAALAGVVLLRRK